MHLSQEIKRIVVAPLDWGLGHASRCVPLIDQWTKEGREVILGINGKSGEWLKKRFPHLITVQIKGKTIHYPVEGNVSWSIIWQIPGFLRSIRKENKQLEKIISDLKPDLIISDNRYGCFSDKVPSIIITHQLFPISPLFKRALSKKIQQLLSPFREVWIPDYAEFPGLAGELSHGKTSLKIKYIGPLSRFKKGKEDVQKQIDYCAIISGPEPLRTEWAKQLFDLLHSAGKKSVILTGMADLNYPPSEFVKIIFDPTDDQIKQHLLSADKVIARSGYSTLMDLEELEIKNVILVSTPGQTEQEYLAQLHEKKYRCIDQKKLSSFKL